MFFKKRENYITDKDTLQSIELDAEYAIRDFIDRWKDEFIMIDSKDPEKGNVDPKWLHQVAVKAATPYKNKISVSLLGDTVWIGKREAFEKAVNELRENGEL